MYNNFDDNSFLSLFWLEEIHYQESTAFKEHQRPSQHPQQSHGHW